MKRILLILLISSSAIVSEAQVLPYAKVGLTMSTFNGGNSDNRLKGSMDLGIGIDKKYNDDWDIGFELNNTLMGTAQKDGYLSTGVKFDKIRVHLYYLNLRGRMIKRINSRLSLGGGAQVGANYYGKTIIRRGIRRDVEGEDDFKSLDWGLLFEGRYNISPAVFVYSNYYFGVRQVFLQSEGEEVDLRNRSIQVGLGFKLTKIKNAKGYFKNLVN
jgi:hypothetical protein